MPHRKSARRCAQGTWAGLSMAKSADAEKAGTTQQSPAHRAQSARRRSPSDGLIRTVYATGHGRWGSTHNGRTAVRTATLAYSKTRRLAMDHQLPTAPVSVTRR
jgi:hypothetical protein